VPDDHEEADLLAGSVKQLSDLVLRRAWPLAGGERAHVDDR
jgi:hypothetical protein